MVNSDVADAWHHRHVHVHYARHVSHHHHRYARGEDYAPPYASIVVDGNSGAVLQASNPDALRHPASLTKVMTLYLLFERLDAGKLRLDTPLKVSEHAADQDPTKLDLKPGQTLTVEEAIKGIVTKSANDAAVAVAENLGGDETTFGKLMTQKAHALGMSHTTYVNASGLPDDDQLTTARDQALLGRAIQERFPHYYKYFSTEAFVFHGSAMRNHNHLLGAIEGVDGIKTGYTRASGFNLLTSVHRDGRYIVAVVLGGPSAGERDERMRELIGAHLREAALHRTAPPIAESQPHEDAQPVAFAKAPLTSVAAASRTDPTPATAAGANDPIRPLLVKTMTFRTAPVQTAAMAPMPALVQVATPGPQAAAQAASVQPASPAVPPPAIAPQADTAPAGQAQTVVASAAPMPAADSEAPADATPRPVTEQADDGSDGETMSTMPHSAVAKAESVTAEPVTTDPAKAEPAAATAPVRAHGGWLIQIGAFDDEGEARQHLSAAQTKLGNASADPFTERVQKGDKALYRARFAGFDRSAAEAACKQLKRSDIDCMAVKD